MEASHQGQKMVDKQVEIVIQIASRIQADQEKPARVELL